MTYAVTAGSSYCTANGATLTGVGVGTCTVTATRAADSNYLVATGTLNITVGKAVQASLTASANPTSVNVAGTTALSISGGSGTGAVTYAVTTGSSFCTLNGSTLTGAATGACTVTATKATDEIYEAATATVIVTVSKASQAALTAAATSTSISYNGTASLSTSGGSGTGAVTYAVTNGSSYCSLNGLTLTGAGVGTCTVTATKLADATFDATTATVDVTVGKATQDALTVSANPTTVSFNGTTTLSTSGGGGTGAVTYAVTAGSSYCILNGATLTGAGVGICTITATKAADANYQATTATLDVTIGKAAQAALTVSASPTGVNYNGTSTLSTSGGSGTGAVTYAATVGSSFCSLNGATLTGIGAGTCTITATKASDTTYQAATATVDVTVASASQTITFNAPTGATVGATATLSATATSNLVVTFASQTTSICTVASSTVTYLTVGSCQIMASQVGDANWQAATPVTRTITIGVATTTTALTADNTAPVLGKPVVLTATVTRAAGSVALTGSVTFKDGSTTLATVNLSAGVATLSVSTLSAGSHSITAVFSGDTNYATSTSNAVTVTPSRPNPANDAKVRALVANQIQTAQRIASQQVDTVNRRLEMLHEDNVPGFVNGVSVVPPGDVRAYSATDPTPLARQGSKLAAVKALDENARTGAALGDKGKGLRPDYYIWTAGAITTARDKIDGLPDKTRTTSQSVTVGVDTWLLAGVKAGVAFGGYTSHGKIDDFGTKDRARAFTGTAYASWNMGDGVFLDGALGYGDARFKSTRYDANASGLLTGSRNGDMVFGSLTASWDQKSGQLKYAPYARFDFSHAWLDRYAEQGDANWALAFDKTTVSSQAAVLGLRGQYDIANGSGTVSPTVRVEYRHAFNGDATQSMSYVADPSTAYGLTVNGSKRDTVTGSLGLKAQGDGALSGQIEYSAGLAVQGGGFAGHGLRGSIRLGF